jgi:hypothetical protein
LAASLKRSQARCRFLAHTRDARHRSMASGYWGPADANANRSRTQHSCYQPPRGAPQESVLIRGAVFADFAPAPESVVTGQRLSEDMCFSLTASLH